MAEQKSGVTIGKPYYYLALVLIAIVIGVVFMSLRQNTQSPLAPPKPELPFSVKSRPALLGQGLVVIITNNSPASEIPVLVTITSAKTNATTSKQMVFNPKQSIEIGYAQGWPFSPGDTLKFFNKDYREEGFTIR